MIHNYTTNYNVTRLLNSNSDIFNTNNGQQISISQLEHYDILKAEQDIDALLLD